MSMFRFSFGTLQKEHNWVENSLDISSGLTLWHGLRCTKILNRVFWLVRERMQRFAYGTRLFRQQFEFFRVIQPRLHRFVGEVAVLSTLDHRQVSNLEVKYNVFS